MENVVTAILSILGSYLIMLITFKRESSKDLQKTLDTKAPYSYVDQTKVELKADLKTHELADIEREKRTLDLIQSMDRKLDILISKK
jgi:hypothetical protein